jgi:hypothetical protein
MKNDYLADLAVKLTVNGAISLKSTIEHPGKIDPDSVSIYAGGGKYTVMTADAVRRHLCKVGAAIMVGTGTYWSDRERSDRTENKVCRVTPLGRELGAYIIANWDELDFRPSGRR